MPRISNKNLQPLLAILNDGDWHDGDALGASLGVSRAAIWKMIKKLVAQGLEIASSKGKGYQLLEPVILLDQDKIAKSLNKHCDINVFETIGSTSDYCRDDGGARQILCCMAEQQTQGRGRFGRKWYSPFARNIYLSLSYPIAKDISELVGLSLVIALAVIASLKSYVGKKKLQAKWPNDILCDDKKLAGILVEVKAESHGSCQVIIGLGLNVNLHKSDDQIDQAWTSICSITDKLTDRNELAIKVINDMLEYLQKFEQRGLKAFEQEWQGVDYLKGKSIQLQGLKQNVQGVVQGINQQGHLLLKFEDGSVSAYSAGDVSIRTKGD